jgi:hypothetical protein
MDLDLLVAFVLPEPAVNPGGRRREGAIRVILSDLVVQLITLERVGTGLLVWLAMKFELNFPGRTDAHARGIRGPSHICQDGVIGSPFRLAEPMRADSSHAAQRDAAAAL